MFSRASTKPEATSSSSVASSTASNVTTTNLSTIALTTGPTKYSFLPNLNDLPKDILCLILRYLAAKDTYRLSNVTKITRAKINWPQLSFINREDYINKRKLLLLANAPTLLRVLLLGDNELKKLVSGAPTSSIGIDFVKKVPFERYNVEIVDSVGQDKFKTLESAFTNSHAVVLFATTQAELQELIGKIAKFQKYEIGVQIVLAHPEGVSLDITGLKINSVFPLKAVSCDEQGFISTIVRLLESKFIKQTLSPKPRPPRRALPPTVSSPSKESSPCRMM